MLDPFGLSSATDKHTQDIFFAVTAPFYALFKPASDLPPITVVLIDEPTFRQQESYPLDDTALAELIRLIACGGAKGVFVDVLIGSPRPSFRPLPSDLLELLGNRPPATPELCQDEPAAPIYLADLSPDASDLNIAPPIEDLENDDAYRIVHLSIKSVAQRLPINWIGERYEYPLKIKIDAKMKSEMKGLERACHDGTRPPGCWITLDKDYIPSPALQLFRDYRGQDADAAIKLLPDKIVVGWGWKHDLPEWFQGLTSLPEKPGSLDLARWLCVQADPDPWPFEGSRFSRSMRALSASLAQGFFAVVQPIREWCGGELADPKQRRPYPLAISAVHFFRGNTDASFLKSRDDAVRNRIVLIGMNAIAASDVVDTPVHGKMPGVLMHAQALDNLMMWGNKVWREPFSGASDLQLMLLHWTALGVAIAYLFWVCWSGRPYASSPARYGRKARSVFLGIVVSLFIALIFWNPNMTPVNFSGLIQTTGILILVSYLDEKTRLPSFVRFGIGFAFGVFLSFVTAKISYWAPISWIGLLFLFVDRVIEKVSSLRATETADVPVGQEQITLITHLTTSESKP